MIFSESDGGMLVGSGRWVVFGEKNRSFLLGFVVGVFFGLKVVICSFIFILWRRWCCLGESFF